AVTRVRPPKPTAVMLFPIRVSMARPKRISQRSRGGGSPAGSLLSASSSSSKNAKWPGGLPSIDTVAPAARASSSAARSSHAGPISNSSAPVRSITSCFDAASRTASSAWTSAGRSAMWHSPASRSRPAAASVLATNAMQAWHGIPGHRRNASIGPDPGWGTMTGEFLTQMLVLLAGSLLVLALVRRFSLPPILGYLLVGMLLGPHALGVLDDDESIRTLADVGVVFLVFTLGLEFSFARM